MIPPRPVIGVTLDYRDDLLNRYEVVADYAKSVERAGGLPIFLPFRSDLSLIPQYVDLVAGILFIGGDDLDPTLYGEPRHPRTSPLDSDRERWELALLAEVERRRMPALGVCLGCQLMNVHRGGSLHQFLPEQIRPLPLEHRKIVAEPARRHPVNLVAGTELAEAAGGTALEANSRHKQAIKTLGRGLRVIATAPDGVIEAIDDPSLPLFLGIQWHPENLSIEQEHLAPFKLLVERASHR